MARLGSDLAGGEVGRIDAVWQHDNVGGRRPLADDGCILSRHRRHSLELRIDSALVAGPGSGLSLQPFLLAPGGQPGAAGQSHAKDVVRDQQPGELGGCQGVGRQVGPLDLQEVEALPGHHPPQGRMHGRLIPGAGVARLALPPALPSPPQQPRQPPVGAKAGEGHGLNLDVKLAPQLLPAPARFLVPPEAGNTDLMASGQPPHYLEHPHPPTTEDREG